jgi:ribA/ribD-fused uncharacterized protein
MGQNPGMSNALRSVADLVHHLEQGGQVKYLFFWGHQPQRDGSIGAGCLSQWWPQPFTLDGITFATAEHYMMWCKARLFGDEEIAAQVPRAGHPSEAKALGRKVCDFDQQVWEERRFEIVVTGNVAKFGQHDELLAYLLGTGERVLVEASPRDRIWGIGMGASNPSAGEPSRWRGRNLLGFALMSARDQLRTP